MESAYFHHLMHPPLVGPGCDVTNTRPKWGTAIPWYKVWTVLQWQTRLTLSLRRSCQGLRKVLGRPTARPVSPPLAEKAPLASPAKNEARHSNKGIKVLATGKKRW